MKTSKHLLRMSSIGIVEACAFSIGIFEGSRMHGHGHDHDFGSERVPLLNGHGRKRYDTSENSNLTNLEDGNASPATNVGLGRFLALENPDTRKLILATIALLVASLTSILIPKFGGKIIDIVSGDIQSPQQRDGAWDEDTSTYFTSS